MRKQHVFFGLSLVSLMFIFTLNSCKKDDKPTPLSLGTLMAGNIDLNGATPPNNVPVAPTLTATFSTEVDQATATSSNITLTEDYDSKSIPLTISVSGKTVTIAPTASLANGALYRLAITSGLKATNGLTITELNRSFTTVGTFVPAGQYAYWNFEGNANDQVGNHTPAGAGNIIGITYGASRNTTAGQAATFNGTTSLIEIPNGDQLMNTHDFTLAFWVKADTSKHGQFVMGLSGLYGFQFEIAGDYSSCKLAAQYDYGDGTSGSEDLWFPGEGLTANSWQGWTYSKDLTNAGGVKALFANKWAHIICQYNSTTKVGAMYINGTKMKTQDFNLWPSGDKKRGVVGLKFAGNAANNSFVFGFIQDKNSPTIPDGYADYTIPTNNHFKGMLDDVRIYHKVLTETEIGLMYNSEKP
jgi:hypothetical protein